MLERRKQRLTAVLEQINMEIDKLKETKEKRKKRNLSQMKPEGFNCLAFVVCFVFYLWDRYFKDIVVVALRYDELHVFQLQIF